MTWYLIPLLGTPQTFTINLLGINYSMTVKWNNSSNAGWQFDMSDSDTGVLILAGQPFVSGASLLANLGYLGIGGAMYVINQSDLTAIPTYENLGTDSNLYFVVSS